ncbi:protein of unknown function [Flavobacterium anhuiense]|uniref:Anti-bacteriophage protein A/HamA C-terminal domain-containing protein n=1 Tax=Flavobacterium anhuiense TaxID=459526 RepID=A0ABY0LTQ1_9FLAO|nr:Hachiman antiphage defense system protein HamA [Flavobacterium anhuiense]SCY64241.1 protein of unknown function [Flavobacterium anhuiense]
MASRIKEIDWLKLIKVDRDTFLNWFFLHEEEVISDDIKVKFYSLKCENNELNIEGFINYLYCEVEKYVFDEKEIKELIEDGHNPLEKALSYFGDIDPLTDGRYGELILYLFVESVLQAPMIVHKISQTYNNNDQVKGADGIFIGNINDKATLLIGESKMRNNFNLCVGDVMESLGRFITDFETVERELDVAKKHLSRNLYDLERSDLDFIYQSLRVKQKEFKEYSICYPAFLMYKEKKIGKIIDEDLTEIENEVLKLIKSVKTKRANYIKKSLPDVLDITLEFFMMPVKDVSSFREMCYQIFHNGKKYERKE